MKKGLIKSLASQRSIGLALKTKKALNKWKKVDINNLKTYPENYTIDEHEAGSVIDAEYS